MNNSNKAPTFTGDLFMDLIFVVVGAIVSLVFIKETVIIFLFTSFITRLIQKNKMKRIETKSMVSIGIIMITIVFSVAFGDVGRFFKIYLKDLLLKGVFSLNPTYLILDWKVERFIIPSILILLLHVILLFFNNNLLAKQIDTKKSKENEIKQNAYADLSYHGSLLVTGATRTGKTATTMGFIEKAIENGQFLFAMDGKGSVTEYSLYDTVAKLCKKYNRKFYVVNQTNSMKSHRVDPFKNLNPTQAKDMLVSMSVWTESFYKDNASVYWIQMFNLMQIEKISFHFESIIYYSKPRNLINLALQSYIKGLITAEECDDYISMANAEPGQAASSNQARFSSVYLGEGKYLFGQGDGFNIREAYKEKAVVVVLLNAFKYSDFARSMGLMMTSDFKNLVGELFESEETKEPYVAVFDEMSVYFDESFNDIVNKIGETKGMPIMLTQTLADLDIIGETYRNQLIGNSNAFITLRANDNVTAEELSGIMGTKRTVSRTHQTDLYEGDTGKGSDRIVNEYKIAVDVIKELPNLHAYWYNKSEVKNPIRFKTKFVDVSGMKAPQILSADILDIKNDYQVDKELVSIGLTAYTSWLESNSLSKSKKSAKKESKETSLSPSSETTESNESFMED